MWGVRCQMSGVRCQVSGVRCQESGGRCQVSGVRCQVSGVRWKTKKEIKKIGLILGWVWVWVLVDGTNRQTEIATLRLKRLIQWNLFCNFDFFCVLSGPICFIFSILNAKSKKSYTQPKKKSYALNFLQIYLCACFNSTDLGSLNCQRKKKYDYKV